MCLVNILALLILTYIKTIKATHITNNQELQLANLNCEEEMTLDFFDLYKYVYGYFIFNESIKPPINITFSRNYKLNYH